MRIMLIQLLFLLCTISQAKIHRDSIYSEEVTVRNGAPTAQGTIYSNFTINDRSNSRETTIDVSNVISSNVYLTDEFIDGDVICMYSCVNKKCNVFHYTIDYILFASDVPQKEVPLDQDPWIAMQVDLEKKHAGSTY